MAKIIKKIDSKPLFMQFPWGQFQKAVSTNFGLEHQNTIFNLSALQCVNGLDYFVQFSDTSQPKCLKTGRKCIV